MAEISDEMYEELRQILEKKNDRSYTFNETKAVGDELIEFYILLMELQSDDNHEINC